MKYPLRVIKAGEQDAIIVKAIQQRLTDINIGSLTMTGVFGAKTTAAVKQFQATHNDANGNPLIIDGKVGPITWAALFGTNSTPQVFTAATPLLTEVISVATSTIGIKESPPYSNRGSEVDEFIRCVGLQPPQHWCAAFVYWCFHKASQNLGIPNPVFKTAGCIDHWNKTTATKVTGEEAFDNPSLIQPGSIFIIRTHSTDTWKGHTGIVIGVDGGFLHTIEGNAGPDPTSSGLGVYKLTKRKINSIDKGFIIY